MNSKEEKLRNRWNFHKINNLENTPSNLAKLLHLLAENSIDIDMLSNFSCRDNKIGYALTVNKSEASTTFQLKSQIVTQK